MKCLKCGGALVPERSTIEKPYRESGLSNIPVSRYIIVRLAVSRGDSQAWAFDGCHCWEFVGNQGWGTRKVT